MSPIFYEANFKFIFIHENLTPIFIHMLNTSYEESELKRSQNNRLFHVLKQKCRFQSMQSSLTYVQIFLTNGSLAVFFFYNWNNTINLINQNIFHRPIVQSTPCKSCFPLWGRHKGQNSKTLFFPLFLQPIICKSSDEISLNSIISSICELSNPRAVKIINGNGFLMSN